MESNASHVTKQEHIEDQENKDDDGVNSFNNESGWITFSSISDYCTEPSLESNDAEQPSLDIGISNIPKFHLATGEA